MQVSGNLVTEVHVNTHNYVLLLNAVMENIKHVALRVFSCWILMIHYFTKVCLLDRTRGRARSCHQGEARTVNYLLRERNSFQLRCLYASSCQFIELRKVVFFLLLQRSSTRLRSRELRFCNHCPVSASAFLCLCFLLVLELTTSQWRKGFEPEGSSLYQRLIATSEQGTAPKQTFTVVKTGSAPNDVGQQGFLQRGLYGDGCQRWTNSRT